MLEAQLHHTGKTWVLTLAVDDQSCEIVVSDREAAELQRIGVDVWVA